MSNHPLATGCVLSLADGSRVLFHQLGGSYWTNSHFDNSRVNGWLNLGHFTAQMTRWRSLRALEVILELQRYFNPSQRQKITPSMREDSNWGRVRQALAPTLLLKVQRTSSVYIQLSIGSNLINHLHVHLVLPYLPPHATSFLVSHILLFFRTNAARN